MSQPSQVDALGAMYQGEKTDSIGIFNVSMVMMAIAVGYVGTTLTLNGDFGGKIPWILVLLLPFPLWLIAVYHALVALSGMTHGVSLDILETALYRSTGLPDPELRDYVGSKLSNKIMDIGVASWPHKIASGFVYGGFYAAIIGDSAYILHAAAGDVSKLMWWVALVAYSVFGALVLITWWLGFRLIKRATKAKQRWIKCLQAADRAARSSEAASTGEAGSGTPNSHSAPLRVPTSQTTGDARHDRS